MSRFRDELRVIPRAAWYIGLTIYLVLSNLFFFVMIPHDRELSKWPIGGKFAFAYGVFLLIFFVAALDGYIYGDAKRRGMRYVMWTWLAVLIPDCIGVIVYFILRDPLPKACPGCSTPVKAGFTFCPHCGAALQPVCPQCGRGVEATWSNCPQCGTKLPLPPPRAA